MDSATILEGTEYTPVDSLSTPELWAACQKREAEINRLRSEHGSLEQEITKREQAEHAARLHPDSTKDQGVKLG